MNIYTCLVSFLFLCISNPEAFAFRKGSIRGKVTDKSTGQSIVGANIMVLSENNKLVAQTNTDENGTFLLDGLEPNTYNVECRIGMYRPQRLVGLFIKESSTRLAYMRLTYTGEPLLTDPKGKKKEDLEYVYTYASIQARQQVETSLATGKNEKLEDIPATGYFISAEDIRQRGYTSLLDVLRDIPEIEIQEKASSAVRNIISSRGMEGSGRFMIMQGGVRINSLVGTDIVIANNIPIFNAKSIEVIIGPVSALYGADAYTGVINITNFKGTEDKNLGFTGAYGMYNTLQQNAYIGFGNDTRSISAGFSYYRSGEPNLPKFSPQDYTWFNEHYSQTGAMHLKEAEDYDTVQIGKILPYDAKTYDYAFNLRAHYKNWELGINKNSANHNSSLGQASEFAVPNSQARTRSDLDNVYLKHGFKSDKWTTNTSLQYLFYRNMPQSVYIDAFGAFNNTHRYASENSLFLRNITNYQINSQHTFSFGGSFQWSKSLVMTNHTLEALDPRASAPAYYINAPQLRQYFFREDRLAGGLFAQYQWQISTKFSLLAGLRFDLISPTHDYEKPENAREYYAPTNPRVGIVFKPNEAFRFKAFAGMASLSTSSQKTLLQYGRIDTFVNGLPLTDFWRGITEDDNADNKPERLYTFETSASYSRNNLVINGNFYGNFFEHFYDVEIFERKDANGNYIPFQVLLPHTGGASFDTLLANHLMRPTKSGNGYSLGGTLSATYSILDDRRNNYDAKISLAYSFLKGKHSENYVEAGSSQTVFSPVHYSAPHTLKMGLSFRYKKFNTYLSGILRAASTINAFSEDEHNDTTNRTFVSLNLFANYRVFESKNKKTTVDVFLRVQNLSNAHYYHVGTYEDFTRKPLVLQDPIRIMGGFTVGIF
jgi:outer membrane receptor for ferrienterochelin and colicin